MPLHTDYRPKSFKEIIGNRLVVDSLMAKVKDSKRPHSYFFFGPAGCGKTTLARIFSSEVGISDMDIREINSSDHRGVDVIRDIIRKSRLSATKAGGCRGWIFDEAHRLTPEAQDALLKPLEEPPPHVYYFLCTTEPHKLIEPIRSRCAEYEVEPLTEKQITTLLTEVANVAGLDVPDEVLTKIAKTSDGRPREALTIMEKVADLPRRQMLRAVKRSVEVETQAIDLTRALMKNNSWDKIRKLLEGLKNEDPERVRRLVLDYASKALLSGDPQGYVVLDCFREPFFNNGRAGLILSCYEVVNEDN